MRIDMLNDGVDTEKFRVWVTIQELNDLIAAVESRAYIDGMNDAESNKNTE